MPENKRNSLVLCVTGGIACGKSEVGRILERMGFAVCDADRVAHGLMKKGTPVYQQVVENFGSGVLDDDGEIARPKLGTVVFSQPEKRRLLDQIVHPAVRCEIQRWVGEHRAASDCASVQIPLLFESGMETMDWDAVVCVSSDEALVLKRLAKRGLDPEAAQARILSQMPLAEKEARSDRVIRNSGTLQELEAATRKALENLLFEREI